MLPKGKRTPKGTADVEHVAAGYTFMSGGSFQLKTGTLVDPDTSDATATASDIRTQKTAYVNAVKVTGTLADHAGQTGISANWQNPAEAPAIQVSPPAGIYPGGEWNLTVTESSLTPENVRATAEIYNVPGTFTSDATATAEDIAAGKTAGINGVMVTGTKVPSTASYQYNEAQIQGTWMHPDDSNYVLQVQTPDFSIVDLISLTVRMNGTGTVWDFGGTTPYDIQGLAFSGHTNDEDIFTPEPQNLNYDGHTLVGTVENVLVAAGAVSFTLKLTVSDADSVTTGQDAIDIIIQSLTT